jgi:hypothetical protein
MAYSVLFNSNRHGDLLRFIVYFEFIWGIGLLTGWKAIIPMPTASKISIIEAIAISAVRGFFLPLSTLGLNEKIFLCIPFWPNMYIIHATVIARYYKNTKYCIGNLLINSGYLHPAICIGLYLIKMNI